VRGLAAAVALAAVALGAGRASAEVIDRVLAIVGGQVVTLSDASIALAVGTVDARGAADPIEAAMNALIERRLVLVEVDRYALPEPGEAAVNAKLAELRQAMAARVPAQETLARLGLDEDRLREIARNDLRIAAYLDQRFGVVQPTEADVQQFYRDHQSLYMEAGTVRPFAEVQADARQRLAAERRQALIDGWKADLRRRADVNVLYVSTPEGRVHGVQRAPGAPGAMRRRAHAGGAASF
jgi:hypothetical protein